MFSTAQSRYLACADGGDMHYAGKKEVYLQLGGKLCVFFFFYYKYSLISKEEK